MKPSEAEKIISDIRSLESERDDLNSNIIPPLERTLILRIQGTWRLKNMHGLSAEEAFEIYLKHGGMEPEVKEVAQALQSALVRDQELDCKIVAANASLQKILEPARQLRIQELKDALERVTVPAEKAVSKLAKDAQEAKAIISQLTVVKSLTFRLRRLSDMHNGSLIDASVLVSELKRSI